MTCIIGLLDKNKVYIGGDTFGSNGHFGQEHDHSKVFRVNDFIIGGTSSFRMLDILEYSFSPRKPYPDDDIEKYMRTVFVDAARQSMKTGGFAIVKDTWCETGGTFLVGYKDKLWEVQGDFSVLNCAPFASCGSGYEVALGSLYTTGTLKMEPEDRIKIALEAASKYIVSVGGKFTILNTGE